MVIQTYDVAVIGGGMVGASIAYHCALQGLKSVLLERTHLASGGSGGNFGLVLPSTGRFDISFALECERVGVKRLQNLKEELDFDVEFRQAHGYCLLCSEDEIKMFSMHRDHFVAAGFGERILTPEELKKCEPNLYVGPETIAVLQTDEATLNPMRLVHAYGSAALHHGAKIQCYSPVKDFITSSNRILEIQTPDGAITAGIVIIAAGSWSRQLALMLNISLPEYYIQGEAVVTEPLPPLLNGFAYWGNVLRIPAEADIAEQSMITGWESRGDEYIFQSYDFGTVQTRRGNILLGQMNYITPSMNEQVSFEVMPGSVREAMRMLPQLKKARILRSWRSPAPFTPDHLPLLGQVPPYDNLYIASGFQSAVTGCPWAGEVITNMICGNEVPEEMERYNPLRFTQSCAI